MVWDIILSLTASLDEFSDATGYDKKQQPIDVSANLQFSDDPNATTDYNDYMVLSTMIGAGGEDLFFGTGSVYTDYAEEGALMDLRTYVSDDVLEKYKDHLIYSTGGSRNMAFMTAATLVFSAAPSRKITIRNLRISC